MQPSKLYFILLIIDYIKLDNLLKWMLLNKYAIN